MSDSVQPHRWQPTRLPHPWDSPSKNTGVGCHFLLQCMKVKSQSEVPQSCPTLPDPMDCSLPGSSVHGILQARVLECLAIAFSGACCYPHPYMDLPYPVSEGACITSRELLFIQWWSRTPPVRSYSILWPLSWLSPAEDPQQPSRKDTQAALWRWLNGKVVRPSSSG